jgi:hypothetical protein
VGVSQSGLNVGTSSLSLNLLAISTPRRIPKYGLHRRDESSLLSRA